MIAIFFVAASLLILDIKSPITAQRLPNAQCAASLFLTEVCWLLVFSADLGKAKANKVDMESTTTRLVSVDGKAEDSCGRRARR